MTNAHQTPTTVTVGRAARKNTVAALDVVGTISDTANKTFRSIGAGVDMLDAFLQESLRDQKIGYILEREGKLETKLHELAEEKTAREHYVEEFRQKNPKMATVYDSEISRLRALIQNLD